MHHNAPLKDRYLHFCSLCDVEPNSGVVGAFQSESSNHQGGPSTPELPQHLSLSGNMAGPRGFLPIVMTLAECPTIRHLDLRDNNLNHESVKELCATLLVPKPWPDPAIHSVDLRGNNNILLSGPDLVSCIKKNPRLLHIEIDSSQLRPLFRRLVQIALQKNVQQANPDDAQYCPFAIEQEAPTESNTGEKEERDLFVAYLRNEAQYATREERQVISDAWKDFQFGTKESEVIDLHGSLMSFGSFRLFEGNEYADVECDSPPNAHTTERCTAGHIGKQTTVRRRNTICDESISCEELDKDTVDGCPNSMASPLPKHNKSVEHYSQLISILEKENLFSHLDEQDLKTAVDILHEERYSAGDVLYHRDDDTAHASMPKDSPSFYIVVNGIIEITEADCSNVTTVGPGNCFGAIRLLHATPRLDVAKCLSASATVFSLHRREYKQLMARISHQRRRLFENFLSELSFLKGMKRSELLNMADALRTHTFQPGEYIIRFGERGRMFFLICEGVVEVLGRGTDMQPKWICDFTRGNCVGELEFLNDHLCVADVRAKTTVKVAMMTRHHFELVMGPAKDILASNAQDLSVYAYYREYQDGSRS